MGRCTSELRLTGMDALAWQTTLQELVTINFQFFLLYVNVVDSQLSSDLQKMQCGEREFSYAVAVAILDSIGTVGRGFSNCADDFMD